MGKITGIDSKLLQAIRRVARKYNMTLVQISRTNKFYFRQLTTHSAPEPTEEQVARRKSFGNLSTKAAAWDKANNPKACPPDGSPEYQDMKKKYKRQFNKHYGITVWHNFVQSKMANGEIKG